MKTIIAHPDNFREIEKLLQRHAPPVPHTFLPDTLCGTKFRPDPHMDKEEKTGRYILPNGATVERDGIRVQGRFCEYGPEDLWYLLHSGMIREETNLLFYVVDDFAIRFRSSMDVMPVVPSSFLFSGGV